MKYLLFLIALTSGMLGQTGPSTLYVSKNAVVTIYSKAPLEDIEASTSTGKAVYNASTGELAFDVPIRTFKFRKSLMQEHFNENYMESDKYPNATFRGNVNEKVDLTKNGTYPVSATGSMDVHGVKQNRTIKGTLIVNNGAVSMQSEFMVRCADHNIEIPKLVFQKIAETIKVNINASFTPYK